MADNGKQLKEYDKRFPSLLAEMRKELDEEWEFIRRIDNALNAVDIGTTPPPADTVQEGEDPDLVTCFVDGLRDFTYHKLCLRCIAEKAERLFI